MNDLTKQFELKPIKTKKRKQQAARALLVNQHVYFIQICASSLVKVGVTKSINGRMKQIANELGIKSRDIDVLGYITVDRGQGYKLEGEIHRALVEFRREGEWFDVAERNLQDVAIAAARKVVSGSWTIHGLCHDEPLDTPHDPWRRTAQPKHFTSNGW